MNAKCLTNIYHFHVLHNFQHLYYKWCLPEFKLVIKMSLRSNNSSSGFGLSDPKQSLCGHTSLFKYKNSNEFYTYTLHKHIENTEYQTLYIFFTWLNVTIRRHALICSDVKNHEFEPYNHL